MARGRCCRRGIATSRQDRLSDQLLESRSDPPQATSLGRGAPLVHRHGGIAGLSGMIHGARARSPLVPQVWLERGRAHNLTRRWPLDLRRRAAVVPSRLRLARIGMKGLKARRHDGVVCGDSCNASPVPLHPPVSRGTRPTNTQVEAEVRQGSFLEAPGGHLCCEVVSNTVEGHSRERTGS